MGTLVNVLLNFFGNNYTESGWSLTKISKKGL